MSSSPVFQQHDAAVKFIERAPRQEPLEATDARSMFHKALLEATETPEGHIVLPKGMLWPDMYSNILFVRHFYKPFWEDVLKCGDGRIVKPYVFGTPGIGKSAFGLYALYQAVRAGKTVIYHSYKSLRRSAIFKEGSTFRLPDLAECAELDKPDTVYISDGYSPVSCDAFTLLVTSPKKGRWHQFAKSFGSSGFVFPTFSEKEIFDLRDLAFAEDPGCDKDSVQMRFLKWGGVPRSVLTHPDAKYQKHELEEVASGLSLETLRAMVDRAKPLSGSVEGVHCLIHFRCQGDKEPTLSTSSSDFYEFAGAELGTKHIIESVFRARMENDRDNLYHFLSETAGKSVWGSLRGSVLESSYVIPLLQTAGTHFPFKCLPFTSGATKPEDVQLQGSFSKIALEECKSDFGNILFNKSNLLHLPKFERVYFRDLDELKKLWHNGSSNILFEPISTKNPVADLILQVSGKPLLVNCTVSPHHDLKKAPLKVLLDILGKKGRGVPFLWMVPKDVFGKFKPTTFCLDNDTKVVQFVVQLDIPDFTKKE